jgi:predicted AAA+ superfamily ATPase
VLAGGFPEALARPDPLRRGAWLNAYAKSLADRDAADLADVSKTAELSRLLGLAAAGAGQTVNLAALARTLGVDAKTVDRWLVLLEQMFVIQRVSAWHRNDLKRLAKTPKLHFLDTGLLAALSRTDARLIAGDRQRLGALLEGFVFSELAKMATQQNERLYVSHFRDHDKEEVDLVLERPGAIVGIEVKATASVKPDDFRGLKALQAATGKAFIAGIVLHDELWSD